MHDIIGDIHGHASRLEAQLRRIGHEQDSQGCRHSEHQVIFVGDFIGRNAAPAVTGEHEFNAPVFKTPYPEQPGERSRPHSDKTAISIPRSWIGSAKIVPFITK